MKLFKSILLFVTVIIVLVAGAILFALWQKNAKVKKIDSFDECVKAGYQVLETYPEQCKTPEGNSFTKQISPGTNITVTGQLVCLPHKLKGQVQTLECAYGIRDNNGLHYALSDKDFRYLTTVEMGRNITVRGVFQNDNNSIYDVVGKIDVGLLEQ
jgi:hypothetical protein